MVASDVNASLHIFIICSLVYDSYLSHECCHLVHWAGVLSGDQCIAVCICSLRVAFCYPSYQEFGPVMWCTTFCFSGSESIR